jgi:hypothetical protein
MKWDCAGTILINCGILLIPDHASRWVMACYKPRYSSGHFVSAFEKHTLASSNRREMNYKELLC